jgi:hypothetical protein
MIINRLVRIYKRKEIDIYVIRAAFQEGKPIFDFERKGKQETSAIYSRSHVQVAVRDKIAIMDQWIER